LVFPELVVCLDCG
jgi:hypothetical protein